MPVSLPDYPSRDEWVTLHAHRYDARQLWYPLSQAVTFWDEDFHQLLLHDYLRMDAFERAISAAMRKLLHQRQPGAGSVRVLDIGTGTGVLAYLAVEAARSELGGVDISECPVRIYAVDCSDKILSVAERLLGAKRLLATPEHPDRPICLVAWNAHDLRSFFLSDTKRFDLFDPPLAKAIEATANTRLFDLLIAETLGGIGDNEDIVRVMRLLVPQFVVDAGMVIPCELSQFVAPVGSRKSTHNTRFNSSPHRAVQLLAEDRHGTRGASPCRMLNANYEPPRPAEAFDSFYDTVFPEADCLATPKQTKKWDFRPETIDPDRLSDSYLADVTFAVDNVTDDNRFFSGFKGFFKALLYEDKSGGGEDVVLNVGGDSIADRQTSDCWKHNYLPIRKQVKVSQGDAVRLQLSRRLSLGNKTDEIEYVWRGAVIHANGNKAGTFDQRCSLSVPAARIDERTEKDLPVPSPPSGMLELQDGGAPVPGEGDNVHRRFL